jgi:hypothetical protein
MDKDIVEDYCERTGRHLERLPLSEDESRALNSMDPLRTSEYLNQRFSNPRVCPEAERIRVLRLQSKEAKGPAWARARGNELVRWIDDDFCLQIDAHTLVDKSWDTKMLLEWGRAENEYAVLSTYPTNWKELGKNSNKHWEMPHLCCANF